MEFVLQFVVELHSLLLSNLGLISVIDFYNFFVFIKAYRMSSREYLISTQPDGYDNTRFEVFKPTFF